MFSVHGFLGKAGRLGRTPPRDRETERTCRGLLSHSYVLRFSIPFPDFFVVTGRPLEKGPTPTAQIVNGG
jgi:hypothetical protein